MCQILRRSDYQCVERGRDSADRFTYSERVKAKRETPQKKDLAAAGKRIRDEVRRSMSRKQGTALVERVLRDLEAE